MKIKSLELSWFRGASESILLETESKNLVVYGTNGSGKSSFVDAIEYIISDGRIDHLAHEYSGSRQRNSIINTHMPEDTNASIKLVFTNDDTVVADIEADGSKTINSDPDELLEAMQSWKTDNYILRQDEVAKFIHLTKGAKYSVLLPLLGLEALEKASDNFNRLHRRIKSDSKVEIVSNNADRLKGNLRKYFTDYQDPAILEKFTELCVIYDVPYTSRIGADAHGLLGTINDRLRNISPESTKHQLLSQCQSEQLEIKFTSFEKSKTAFEEIATDVIDKKIEVLQTTHEYLLDIDEKGEIECPACGQTIDSEEFNAHIESEMAMLEEARLKKDQYELDERAFRYSFSQVLRLLSTEEMKTWMTENRYENIAESVERLNSELDQSQPIDFNSATIELTDFIDGQIGESPPEIIDLLSHLDMVKVIRSIPGIKYLDEYCKKITFAIKYLQECETQCQVKLKEKAEIKIRELTQTIQELWRKIHPDEPIEDVSLYIPENTDKAIDISLKFFGVEQPSPRVTLSEGHRNSLGLCIFLALAQSNPTDDPIILDDIVSSLDQDHRTRFTTLILNEMRDRQVILFTHDRDYYTELRFLQPERDWSFSVLSPWSDPTTGIQWAKSTYSFDDARALLPDYPEPSGNRARSIMDSHMSVVSERLQIPLPHLRGARNDNRTCIKFLDSLISVAKTSFKKKQNGSYSNYTNAIGELDTARRLVLAYGNPASHGREVSPNQVTVLIDACETALNVFRCPDCNDYVWRSDQSSRKRLQCPCGGLRWQYG